MIGRLLTLTVADIRSHIRNRSVLIFSLIVPIALMSVLNVVYSDATEAEELQPVAVALTDDGGAEATATALTRVLPAVDGVDVTVLEVPDPQAALAAGEADLAVDLDGSQVSIIPADSEQLETAILTTVITGVAEQVRAGEVVATAVADPKIDPAADPEEVAAQLAGSPTITLTHGRASSEQLSEGASLVAGQAGLFLLFTVGFGVLALNTEREQGTLQRLYAAPISRFLITASKALAAGVLGVLATGILLVTGSLLFDVDFGSVPAVTVLVFGVVVAATSLTFILARLARTAEQASMAQAIVALVLGISGGAFFPLDASGTVGRVLDANPITAFSRGLGITSGGGGMAEIAGPIGAMTLITVIAIVLARVVPDRGSAR